MSSESRRPPADLLGGPPGRPRRPAGRAAAAGPQAGSGPDGLVEAFASLLPAPASARRDALLAALNGVLGDHLVRSADALAIAMQLRRDGRVFDPQDGVVGDRLLLLVHGLCLSDRAWCRDGHDHGAALQRDLGFDAVYAFYNSGQPVAVSGLALAAQIESLLRRWPRPLRELSLVGHGLGGLVVRSACQQARAEGRVWPRRLRRLVFVGTPHHGAPLQQAGHWLHRVLDLCPYVAPFDRLSALRSAGLIDLGLGAAGPLPAGVECFAVATTAGAAGLPGSRCGDGLVPLDSALGRHADARRSLAIPRHQQWVGHGLHHLEQLSSAAVYRRLRRWLGD